jgi:uncharacterized membrane protein
MPAVGFCCLCVLAAFRLQNSLSITSKISFVEVHLVMHLTVKVGLIGHSRTVLEPSHLVGWNFRFVIGQLLELSFVSYN